MRTVVEDQVRFYALQSVVTDPGHHRELYTALPDDIPSLCRIVQGLILHMHWAEAYGIELPDERKTEVRIGSTERQIARILELDASPLTVARPLQRKIVGTCRDFAALLTSFLRHKGIPARMRVGFARYFTPGRYEDHYLCQYWHTGENRWVIVDAQLDEFQRRLLGIEFDPCNVPDRLFLPGGKAWRMCREGEADPRTFGIFDIQGMWFVGVDTIFDTLSLNKIECHPWDVQPLMPQYGQEEYSSEYLQTMDHIAGLTGEMAPDFYEVRRLYHAEKRLQPLPGWKP